VKHGLLLLLAVLVCVGLAGCYATPVKPPTGWVYSQFKAPLSADLQGVKVDPNAKMGSAKVEAYLGIVATGDCSAAAAAKDGGIANITHADYEYFNVLGLYQKFTVTVYGN